MSSRRDGGTYWDWYLKNLMASPEEYLRGIIPRMWAASELPLYQELTCLASQALSEECK